MQNSNSSCCSQCSEPEVTSRFRNVVDQEQVMILISEAIASMDKQDRKLADILVILYLHAITNKLNSETIAAVNAIVDMEHLHQVMASISNAVSTLDSEEKRLADVLLDLYCYSAENKLNPKIVDAISGITQI